LNFTPIINVPNGDVNIKRRRPYASTSSQADFIKCWRESGLTQGVFCAQNNIHKKTFSRWLKKVRASDNNGSFLESTDQAVQLAAQEAINLKVVFYNGSTVNISGPLEMELILSIIQEVSRCKFN